MQIYVQGARSRFHASGPKGTMIRPWARDVTNGTQLFAYI